MLIYLTFLLYEIKFKFQSQDKFLTMTLTLIEGCPCHFYQIVGCYTHNESNHKTLLTLLEINVTKVLQHVWLATVTVMEAWRQLTRQSLTNLVSLRQACYSLNMNEAKAFLNVHGKQKVHAKKHIFL